jgi:hypothetical protein
MAIECPAGQFWPDTVTSVPGGPLVGLNVTDGFGAAAKAPAVSTSRSAVSIVRTAPSETAWRAGVAATCSLVRSIARSMPSLRPGCE